MLSINAAWIASLLSAKRVTIPTLSLPLVSLVTALSKIEKLVVWYSERNALLVIAAQGGGVKGGEGARYNVGRREESESCQTE